MQSELLSPQEQQPKSTDAVIQIQGLKKCFRDFWLRPRVNALNGVDLQVNRGEVFGLLGPNGSGKSTTIKILLGLLFPSSGKVEVLGHEPSHVATKARIGYLPEESYLYPFLDAYELLDYYGRLFHIPKAERGDRVEQLIQMVGLDNADRRRIGEYSKGMQRRVGLAQALINNPDLLILDEPTSGLDPLGTHQMKDLIVELKKRGTTVLLSSHLLDNVEDVCDRVAILYGGHIQAMGKVESLLQSEDRQVIESDLLSSELNSEIEQLIQSSGADNPAIRPQRQRLETLFLDIVDNAQGKGQKTSGASSGGEVADFLGK